MGSGRRALRVDNLIGASPGSMEGEAGAVFDTGSVVSGYPRRRAERAMECWGHLPSSRQPGWAYAQVLFISKSACVDGDAWAVSTGWKAAFCLVPIKGEGLQLSNDKCPDSTRTRWAG